MRSHAEITENLQAPQNHSDMLESMSSARAPYEARLSAKSALSILVEFFDRSAGRGRGDVHGTLVMGRSRDWNGTRVDQSSGLLLAGLC